MKKLISIFVIIVLLSGIFTQAVAIEFIVVQSKISTELMSEFGSMDTTEYIGLALW